MKKKATITRKYGGVRASLRVSERREKLLEAGLTAFGTRGYARTGIRDICALAQLTERYFYESFKNKEELLSRVYNNLVDDLLARALAVFNQPAETPAEAVMNAIRFFFTTLHDDPRKARMLYFEVLGVSERIDQEYQAATFRLIDAVGSMLCRAFPGWDRARAGQSILPTGIAGALNHIIVRWYLEQYATPTEDLLAQVAFYLETAQTLLRAVLTQKPHAELPAR